MPCGLCNDHYDVDHDQKHDMMTSSVTHVFPHLSGNQTKGRRVKEMQIKMGMEQFAPPSCGRSQFSSKPLVTPGTSCA